MTTPASKQAVRLWLHHEGEWRNVPPRECSCDADPEHEPHNNEGERIEDLAYLALPAAAFKERDRRIVLLTHSLFGQRGTALTEAQIDDVLRAVEGSGGWGGSALDRRIESC